MKSVLLFIFFLSVLPLPLQAKGKCTYEYRAWNVLQKKSGPLIKVKKNKKKLSKTEIGALGCTPCLEDQKLIKLSNGLEFRVCKKIADDVGSVLETVIAEGFPIKSVLGYKAQMSKGKVDAKGYRTELSLHSFGVAIDVNRENNGLYDNCVQWNPSCRLMHGGAWSLKDRFSIKPKSLLVQFMKEIGLKWGGAIRGRQKDFMHFSPTGY